jgi:hypothetical protein
MCFSVCGIGIFIFCLCLCLVGGMILRVDDTLVDASVKSQLERMKNELSS